MTIKSLGAAMLAILLSAGSALAADASVKPFDSDNDGTINLAEAKAAGAKLFAVLDTDKDGTLDKKELKGRVSKKAFKKSNLDNDKTLDQKEFEALIEYRFKAANKDSDNTVDDKELSKKKGKKLLQLMQ